MEPPTAFEDYLADLPGDQRRALEELVAMIATAAPDAEPGRSYGAPAFRLRGRPLAGFKAARSHLSYLPFSAAVVESLAEELADWPCTKGTVRFSPDHPLTAAVVEALVAARRAELEG